MREESAQIKAKKGKRFFVDDIWDVYKLGSFLPLRDRRQKHFNHLALSSRSASLNVDAEMFMSSNYDVALVCVSKVGSEFPWGGGANGEIATRNLVVTWLRATSP